MTLSLHLDYRLALALLSALILAAAAPLAYGWARLLPEDAPAFQPPEQKGGSAGAARQASRAGRDPVAVALLVCVTVSFWLQFPGIPLEQGEALLARGFSPQAAEHIFIAGGIFFAVAPGMAAAYALVRKSFLRWPLFAGGVLVLLLWLLSAPLAAALLSG